MGWWTRGPTIGRGSSATVSLATAVTGELFAVKSTELSCSSLLQKEKSLISQLSSPYIVEYRGCDITCENDKSMYNLLMEYMPGGTLSDLIKKQGGSLEESRIQLYAHQLLQGLEYLHLNGIAHCDIKGQNVLVGKDGVKIADLGCARMVEDGNAGDSTIAGTPIFMSPEVARGEEQGFEADIWALGCTIIEMATGCSPWPEMNDPVSALYRIGYSSDVPELPWWLSNNAKEFLSECLRRDARERWTAKQLLQHPFFHGLGANSREVAEFVRISPTSVLDKDFWDAMEVSESSESSSSHSVSSFNSPAERIKHLIGDAAPSSSTLPNWTEDEGWVTVRGIAKEECHQPNHIVDKDFEELMAVESFLFLFVSDEEFASSITIEDLLLLCCFYEINTTRILAARISLTLFFESVYDSFVLRIIDFRNKITEYLFLMLLTFSFKFLFMFKCFIYLV